jgi:hypothetical protein
MKLQSSTDEDAEPHPPLSSPGGLQTQASTADIVSLRQSPRTDDASANESRKIHRSL